MGGGQQRGVLQCVGDISGKIAVLADLGPRSPTDLVAKEETW